MKNKLIVSLFLWLIISSSTYCVDLVTLERLARFIDIQFDTDFAKVPTSNIETGRIVRLDLGGLARFIDTQFGTDFVQVVQVSTSNIAIEQAAYIESIATENVVPTKSVTPSGNKKAA